MKKQKHRDLTTSESKRLCQFFELLITIDQRNLITPFAKRRARERAKAKAEMEAKLKKMEKLKSQNAEVRHDDQKLVSFEARRRPLSLSALADFFGKSSFPQFSINKTVKT